MINDIVFFFKDQPTLMVASVFLIGLMIGSFLNVVIYRLPKMLMNDWTAQAQEILSIIPAEKENKPFNLLFPPSTCPSCGHQISPFENIPIISYLFLKGRCKSCRIKISMRYPLVELCAGLLAAWLVWYAGFSVQTVLLILLTWCLLTLSLIDIDHQLLPDALVLPFLWIGLIANNYELFTDMNYALWGAVLGYMVLWIVNATFKLIRGYDGMGHGDFKLLALFGAWGGWQILPIVILCSALAGAVIGGILLAVRGGNKIPYGPYLAIAGWVSLMWGSDIINCYLAFSGLG